MISRQTEANRVAGATLQSSSLGDWCIQQGLATPDQIQACLDEQRKLQKEGKAGPRLGELLIQRGLLTAQDLARALAHQKKEIRHCPRCQVRINVPQRADVAWYRCGHCQGPLLPIEPSKDVAVIDDEFQIVSRDPVPEAVQEAMQRPDSRFGKYVLVHEIGKGGIGIVFLAWDLYLSQYVALKRLRVEHKQSAPEMADFLIRSLIKEARNAIRLRHPGIVSIFDIGRVGREYYVAMEYLEGRTLHEISQTAKSNGNLSPYFENPRRTLKILAEVAKAVHYAHSHPSSIVHCDLKPANILIDASDAPHVVDFGLARNLKVEGMESGEISGTPSYMAPEQASGETQKIDARTDVYALGAILYEMLSGSPPFVGDSIHVLYRTVKEDPVSPTESVRETTRRWKQEGGASTSHLLRIPPALEELCMRCLRKDRAERPSSMAEVSQVLEQAIAPVIVTESPRGPAVPETPAAEPGSPIESGTSKKSRMFSVAAGLLLLILGSGSGWVLLNQRAPTPATADAVALDLTGFLPDATLSFLEGRPATPESRTLLVDAGILSHLKKDLLKRLASDPLPDGDLVLRDRTLRHARILEAGPQFLLLSVGEGRMRVRWSDVDPAQILQILRQTHTDPTPEQQLALGVYCLRAGMIPAARRYFYLLSATSQSAVAEQYLAEMDRPSDPPRKNDR